MPARKKTAVSEPIQVYLTPGDRTRLDRAAKALGVPRAEVLRLGLRRVSESVSGRASSMQAFLDEMNAGPWPADLPHDVGLRHDEELAKIYRDRGRTPKRRKR